jgi:hypothetical protein
MEPRMGILARAEGVAGCKGLEFRERRRCVVRLIGAMTVGQVIQNLFVAIDRSFHEIEILLDLSELGFHKKLLFVLFFPHFDEVKRQRKRRFFTQVLPAFYMNYIILFFSFQH